MSFRKIRNISDIGDNMKTKEKAVLVQQFVTEGRFLAMPMTFEGESYPIPPDESYLNAFAENPKGDQFYGSTGGKKCHVFAGGAKGACGGILDLGVAEGAFDIPVVLHLKSFEKHYKTYENIIFIANMQDEATIYCSTVLLSHDSIQEPSFYSFPFEPLTSLLGTRFFDAVLTPDCQFLIGLSDKGILSIEIETGKVNKVFECNLNATFIKKLAQLDDQAYFIDKQGEFIALDLSSLSCTPTGIKGNFDEKSWGFCICQNSILYANGSGKLFAFDTQNKSIVEAGQAPLPEMQCMCNLPDNRIFGVCGAEIGFFFRFDFASGTSEALGAIVTAMGTRRYGFEFSKMTTGKDGEIYLCENDRGGHLWIYSPSISI